MDPTTEANKKRPWVIDLNLPPPPEDGTNGETHQDSPPPPVEAAANSGQANGSENHHQLQADENGSDGKQEEEKSPRKRRKVTKDSQAPTAEDGNDDDDGGVQGDKIEMWQNWGKVIQTVAWESGDDGTVDWKELMNREQPETAGSTVRNGSVRDEDENGGGNNNAAEEVSGAAPPEVSGEELPVGASPAVVRTKSGRVLMRPKKFTDSVLLELPSSRHSRSSSSSANIRTPRRSRK